MPRPDYMKDCTVECERTAKCRECGRRKKPHGRHAPLEIANSLCDQECPGYDREPKPPHLWPGELAEIDQLTD